MKFFIALLALALSAGCEGQNPNAAFPQSSVPQSQAHEASGSSGDLVYALARGPRNEGRVYVLTYPAAKYITQFYTPIRRRLNSACTDAAGDVFITQYDGQGYIYKYSHGATSPSATLTLNQPDIPVGCAVNSANGDLAVSFGAANSGVAIFRNAFGTPNYYTLKGLSGAGQATFDSSGNLFAIFLDTSEADVFELPNGSKALTQLEFDTYMNAYCLQWDGKHLAIAIFDQHGRWLVYRVAVSDFHGQIISTINFQGLGSTSSGSFWIQGNRILVPVSKRSKNGKVAIYRYPQGENPESIISGYKVSSLTVSRIRK
jgi:hypothetical protein